MDTLRIRGGPLRAANVSVSGFKHLAVPAIASALLLPAELTLTNVPAIEDTVVLCDVLELLGAKIDRGHGALKIDARGVARWSVPSDLSRRVHGSLYLVPALLGRFGRVEIGDTGGCRIGGGPDGQRPVRHVREVLRRFSPTVEFEPGRMCAQSGPFRATEIDILDWSDDRNEPNGPLVSGATKTAILAALAVKRGETVIHNPYWKPDVTGLLEMLDRAGAAVEVSPIRVRIRRPIQVKPISFELLSDLGEIMTWLACSVHSQMRLHISNVIGRLREGLAPELAALAAMGLNVVWQHESLALEPPARLGSLKLAVRSHGIYSDHHPLFTLLALRAGGESTIREGVWTNRFRYVSELQALGADLRLDGTTLHIRPCRLRAAARRLQAPDLRAAAVLLIAAVGIDGVTELSGVSELRRGYPHLVSDLQRLGASIDVVG